MDPTHAQLLIAQLIVSLLTVAPVLGSLWKVVNVIRRVERKFDRLMVEHEMLVVDYCDRKGIKLGDLPTRTSGVRTSSLEP